MAKGMKIIAVLSAALTLFFVVFYPWNKSSAILSAGITCGTIAYHFWMRLAVGAFYDRRYGNRVDDSKKQFDVGPREMKLYRLLRVKQWKNRMPTYDPAVFDPAKHSWEEIVGATCQSELVHKTIAVLSLLPLIAPIWFGSFWVFALTSLLSAMFDLSFVAMQRYNRARLRRLIRRKEKTKGL